MKIFNWVHRKLYQKDGMVRRNVKKDELRISNEIIGDAQVLLQDASIARMLDSWKGGILTIGTFGFDPLKNVQDQIGIDIEEEEVEESLEEEYYSVESIGQCEITVTKENEEVYPLIYASGGEVMIEYPKQNEIMVIDSNNSLDSNKMLKKERITLADLFSADSDHHQNLKPNPSKKEEEFYTKKPCSQVKNGTSFAKKLIPRVKEDSRPIQKLQQLMTRVMKRKVHPDIESKIGKNNNTTTHQVKAAASMLGLSCGKHVRVDSVSLLQLDQDATA
ncbi:PREDICTED: uncharacterized protein LOC109232239 [Nicotiana attenuata]|uniref:Protein TILLER ANGLE CONTROL 1 n=1 Tax=Nicotiana attenuata TaxID=49451 RepID=A0A1J6I0V4_NICAT|nr:PREDICTED: uncharacterized protein LOC109232239 [Nicotiana attenuata]OIS98733.1 hypothetical protein A4A49_06238 [Nicotiana attenuata]